MSYEVKLGHNNATLSASANPEYAEKTRFEDRVPKGALIVNADDWGRDQATTDRILECWLHRSVSSTSAMVFMSDSERAAGLARQQRVDTGLHVNFTLPFSAQECPALVREYQRKLGAYLNLHGLARAIFHPGLVNMFEYVVKAQLEEFARLFGKYPERIDGHHHMHLCANVLFKRLLPPGTVVRRNFSFLPGEKSAVNRFYRKAIDRRLARRYRIVDYLFNLAPLEPRERLERISSVARQNVVEVETHPANADEYRFLMGEEVVRWTNGVQIARDFVRPQQEPEIAQGGQA